MRLILMCSRRTQLAPPLLVGGNSRDSDIDVEAEVSPLAAGLLGPRQGGRLLLLDEFPKTGLLDLAEGVARQFIHDEHLLGHFEPG